MNRQAMKSVGEKLRRRLLSDVRTAAAEQKNNSELSERIKKHGFDNTVEEAAFIWFARFTALHFMESNGYLPSEKGLFDKNQKSEELIRKRIISQGFALSESLPWIFGEKHDWALPLMPQNLLGEGGIAELISEIKEEDWQEGVEMIGWLYQYYMSEKHDEIINVYKGTVKKEDIPAATQLFTTDWIVKYMVDNSLGRYYIEHCSESRLREKLEFLIIPEHEEREDTTVIPQKLTFFDPCMGAGHILVYAFSVLMEIYREQGFGDSEAAEEIVKHNLIGLDIDDRCARLACFAVMMKGRSYDESFLEKGLKPNLLAVRESGLNTAISHEKHNETITYLEEIFCHGKETGALIKTEKRDYNELYIWAEKHTWGEERDYIQSLARQAEMLSGKYIAVCTNPPYMNRLEGNLKDYVNMHYKAYSSDLFSVFMYRNFDFCKENGYCAFMTPFVWMFIKTYEPLRRFIIENKSIESLVQLEYSAYEDAAVPVCTFVLKNSRSVEKGLYIRLSEFKGGMKVQRQKALEAIHDPECGYVYKAVQSDFMKIPHAPIAYWAKESIINAFSHEKTVEDVAQVKIGMGTGRNEHFLRNWWEVSLPDTDFSLRSVKDLEKSCGKWFPYSKGGDYRLWYGNNREVIWYDEEGRDRLKRTSGYRENGGYEYYFREGITWTFISSSKFGVRYRPFGSVFDVAGSTLFADREDLYYLLAFLCSSVSDYILKMLNPTMNYQAGNIKSLPVIFGNKEKAERLAAENTEISKEDWDSFETSWDFRRHPLL